MPSRCKNAAQLLLLPALLALAGCCHGLRMQTKAHLNFETPVTAHLTMHREVSPETSPLAEVPIGGSHGAECGPKIAVVDVDGLLVNSNLPATASAGENPVTLFTEKLAAAEQDATVCGVIVRLNSPGGGVDAAEILAHELVAFRQRTHKPVVACIIGTGTGAAYYLATCCDRILAQPNAVIGGIGVILNLYNLSDAMAQYNVIDQSIKAGNNIDVGSMRRAISPEQRQLLQAIADDFHERFKAVVLAARPSLAENPNETLDGRIFSANQALKVGLIDQVGHLDSAVEAIRAMTGQSSAHIILFRRHGEGAYSIYATLPNLPPLTNTLPVSIPGLDRSRLPLFLYLWQPEPTAERLGGK